MHRAISVMVSQCSISLTSLRARSWLRSATFGYDVLATNVACNHAPTRNRLGKYSHASAPDQFVDARLSIRNLLKVLHSQTSLHVQRAHFPLLGVAETCNHLSDTRCPCSLNSTAPTCDIKSILFHAFSGYLFLSSLRPYPFMTSTSTLASHQALHCFDRPSSRRALLIHHTT